MDLGLKCCFFLAISLTGCQPHDDLAERPAAAAIESEASVSAYNARVSPPPPGQKRAAVYLSMRNPLPQDAVILNVSTPVAAAAEVHRHTYENGLMKMRHVAHVRVPAKGELAFEPGGYHIMLMDLSRSLESGSAFELTFEFDNGQTLVTSVLVQAR